MTSNMVPKTANKKAAAATALGSSITLEDWLERLQEAARIHKAEAEAITKEAEAIAMELDRLRAEKQQKSKSYNTAKEDIRQALDALPSPGHADYTRSNEALEAASRRRSMLGGELERLEQQITDTLARQRENEKKKQDQAAYREESRRHI